MTEGPTARIHALRIEKQFKGETLKDLFIKSKKLYIDPSLLIGRKLSGSTSFGKNILLYFNEYAIRIHLMMYGSIRFEGEYSKPFSRVRLTLFFPETNLVVYNAPIVEVDTREKLWNRLSSDYGVDPLTNWDEEKLLTLILENKERKIGDLLLDQRVFNGIGNILRNEILFRSQVNPEKLVEELESGDINRIMMYTKDLTQKFLEYKLIGKGIKPILLIYNKKICPRCKSKILFYRQEPNKRKTFYCSNCQQ